jgi:hypothetical protein
MWNLSQPWWWRPNVQPFGFFLLGVLAIRSGLLLRPHEHRRTIRTALLLGIACFLAMFAIQPHGVLRSTPFG